MNGRVTAITVLVVLIIGGLIAGLFMGSIQNALTLPMVQAMMSGNSGNQTGQTTKPPAHSVPPTVIPAKPTPVQTAMLAQDLFRRTDQPLWGTASDGQTWGGDANTLPVFAVTNATGQIANKAGTFNAVLGAASPDVEVVLNGMVNHFAGGANLGAVVRWTDGNNWYKALIDGDNLTLLKRVHGTTVQIASVPFTAQGNTPYTLRFRIVGTTIFAKVWLSSATEPANWMIVITDTAITMGQAGVRVLLQHDTVVTVFSFVATKAGNVV